MNAPLNMRRREGGNTLIVAVVIMVVLASMAAALAKMYVSGVDTAAENMAGTHVFNVAESGIQVTLKKMVEHDCDPSAIPGATTGAGGVTTFTHTMFGRSFEIAVTPQADDLFRIDAHESGSNNRRDVTQTAKCVAGSVGSGGGSSNLSNLTTGANSSDMWQVKENNDIQGTTFVFNQEGATTSQNNTLTFFDNTTEEIVFSFDYEQLNDVPTEVEVEIRLQSGPALESEVALEGGSGSVVMQGFGVFNPAEIKFFNIKISEVKSANGEYFHMINPCLRRISDTTCPSTGGAGFIPRTVWNELF